MRRRLLLGLASAPLGLLGGCAGIGARSRESDRHVFALSPVQPPSGEAVSWQLVVEEPATPAMLDRSRIALQRADGQFSYFADASWSDRLGALVRLMLLQSFSNSGRIMGLAGDTLTLRADYQLRTALRAFQARYTAQGQAPEAWVAVGVQLVRLPDRVAVDATQFEVRTRTERDSMVAIAAALDDAFGQVQSQIVDWTLAAGVRDYGVRR